MHLEIGGGHIVPPEAINLDPVNGTDTGAWWDRQGQPATWKRLAQEVPWPCGDEHFDSIRASHVMEHIPAGANRINVMNEAHRVLKPGAVFEIIVPGLVARNTGEMVGWWAIADPTHVSFWVPESFHYFDGTFAANADYGIKLWNTESLEILSGWEIHWKGTKR